MKDEILEALLDVFNSANYRFLTLAEVTHQLLLRGFYQNIEFHKAQADVWDLLCRNQTAKYQFWDIERSGETLWGLERWLPIRQRQEARDHSRATDPLQVGSEIQHIVSTTGSEIETGIFPLRGRVSNGLITNMDEQQHTHAVVELHCYGNEKFMCAIAHDVHDNWFLEGKGLKR